MALPLLDYPLSSRNHRVCGYEVPSEEQPRIYSTVNQASAEEMDELIWSAYYQVFHQQQMLSSTRQPALESQLRNGQISVRGFIRGLATSDAFRRLNYDSNNNYRFVEICVQRLLGRQVYSDREKLAWSIVLATQGLPAFIDALLDSQEYLQNFGEHRVPYQQRRILPGRSQGESPFFRTARYSEDYRDRLPQTITAQSIKPWGLQAFLHGSNKDVVLWLVVSLIFVIGSYYLLPIMGLLPQISPY